MILVYVTNERIDEVVDIVEFLKQEYGNVDYRNPKLFQKPEKCTGVYVHGDFPKVSACYNNHISLQDTKRSVDYTVREIQEMRKDIDDFARFIKGDKRKSVQAML